jgi:hypothetical protein
LYIEQLINSPNWTSVDSILTRLHQVTAALSLFKSSIAKDPILTRTAAALSKLKTFDAPTQATPATKTYVLRLIQLFSTMGECQMSALLALMWMGALRLADALRLPNGAINTTALIPFFQLKWHKNQKSARGIKVLLQDSPLFPPLARYAKSVRTTQPLFFSIQPTRARNLLSRHSTITGHSIRRGALQAMAAAGTKPRFDFSPATEPPTSFFVISRCPLKINNAKFSKHKQQPCYDSPFSSLYSIPFIS